MVLAAAALLSVLAASTPGAPPVPSAAFFEAHREKFLSKLPAGSIAVLRAATDTAADTRADSFRQDSAFWYLTGLEEPNAIALFVPGAGKEGRYVLFVQPRDFAAEQWTGWRAGGESAKKDYGAGQAWAIGEFWDRFPGLAASVQSLFYTTGGDKDFQGRLLDAWNAGNANARLARPAADASPILDTMRLRQDPLAQGPPRGGSRLP